MNKHKFLLHAAIVLSLSASFFVSMPANAERHQGAYVMDQVSTIGLLKSQGYTDIKLTGFDLSGAACGKHDLYVDKFEATTRDGKRVEGFACGEYFPEIKLLRYF